MNAIKFPGANANFTLPGCDDLPARTQNRNGQHTVTTMWTPSAEERDAIAAGHPIALQFLGTASPPTRLYVPAMCPGCGHEVQNQAEGRPHKAEWWHLPCIDIASAGA